MLPVSNKIQKINYSANSGFVAISTANTNLDGTGSLGTVLTAASNGTLIRSITIKATGTTTRGMVRLFIGDGSTFTRIVDEIDVPARIQSSKQDAFSITYDVNFSLKAGYLLYASTEKAEGFVVTALGLDYSYPTSLDGL